MNIEAILSPLELPALARRDLSRSACVVFDILRATSTFVTALHHGAAGIIPVSEISEAMTLRQAEQSRLLAGERKGLRIRAAQSGGVDFDFGNSPREFTPEKVRGRTIVSTTTNGTRALNACAGAKCVLAASFLNLSATADFLSQSPPEELVLVCAGTGDDVADEDVLAAGALTELLAARKEARPTLSETSVAALNQFAESKPDLPAALGRAKNGSRLLGIPELREDVAFCAQMNIFPIVAMMGADGVLRRQR